MNGILVIVFGVAILYLVVSGRLDCFIKALQACSGADGKAGGTGAAPASTTGTAGTATSPAHASQVVDRVLSSTI